MAISYSKLKLSVSQDTIPVEWNGQTIEVKKYLPVQDELSLITTILNASVDENRFYNPVKFNVFFVIEIIEFFTNIKFTEKQKENAPKLYDELISSGFYDKIYKASPIDIDDIRADAWEVIDNIYKYQNSIYGVLDNVSKDYDNLNLDAEDIEKKIANKDNIQFLNTVLTKLG